MKKTFFAISMGFITPHVFDITNPKQEDICSNLLREISKVCLDAGTRIYLQFSSKLIKSINDVYEVINKASYCIVSFDTGRSLCDFNDLAKSVISSQLKLMMSSSECIRGRENQSEVLSDLEVCFEPYVVTSMFDSNHPIDATVSLITADMQEKVSFGRSLSIETKNSQLELFSQSFAEKK